jgi:FkbM family methyltransferase
VSLRNTIREWLARRLQVPRIDFALERLRNAGFQPELIFDVGAYQGDFAKMVLRNWPASTVACFEVQQDPLRRLRKASDQGIQVFECLLGAEPNDSVRLHLGETASSILTEIASPQSKFANFPMRSIDDVVKTDLDGRAPELLKLDVQGYELEVLKGAEANLSRIQVVLAEVNLLDIHKGVPLLHKLVGWFAERNWVAFDICGLTRRPLDLALWQADFVFVPTNSPLRSDKRWV